MKILGLSAFYHDSAAALLVDGSLVAAAQEERFTRKKHDPGFPAHAVRYCLDHAGISLDEVDAIVFYDKPFLKFERLLETYLAFAPRGFTSFAKALPIWLKEKLFQKDMLVDALKELGADKSVISYGAASRLRYFQSNGGMASMEAFARKAVYAVNSGPAAAPRAGTFVARPLGIEKISTVDMGGTSFDVALCHSGRTNIAKNVDILRYRLGIPVIQVEMLGAGGGSIASVDRYGMLHVGPQSAGVSPGPACYRRGGGQPTVTDANVVLGYLNPQALLAGRLPIDAEAARKAVAEHIAAPLGVSVDKAAYGVFRVVNSNMVAGIRRVSVERGYDPRDYSLVAAGGATGAHITALAREIGIRSVLVPKLASGLCAFGQVLSDVKYSYMAACPARLDERTDLLRIEWMFQGLEAEGIRRLQQERFSDEEIRIERSLDIRYVGQIQASRLKGPSRQRLAQLSQRRKRGGASSGDRAVA